MDVDYNIAHCIIEKIGVGKVVRASAGYQWLLVISCWLIVQA